MHYLFEYGDILNAPYEAFLFDTNMMSFPIRPHWHYYAEILFMLEGTALVSSKDLEYVLQPGDMIFLPPKAVHGIYTTTQMPLRYYVIKLDLNRFREQNLIIPNLKSIILQAELDPQVSMFFANSVLQDTQAKALIAMCVNEASYKKFGYLLAIHSSLSELLLLLVRIWCAQGFQPSMQTLHQDEDDMSKITEYIDANSNKPLRVEDLAEKCHMSYSFFAKKFKQQYGRSCKEYIEYIRITKAEDLLLFTNYDLNYISQETGFSDCSHMIKTFRKYKNITPKQFRMQHTLQKTH